MAIIADLLVVAGGGAGGGDSTGGSGGGGGAGGVVITSVDLEALTMPVTVTVGAGGASLNADGENSYFGSVEAIGGGGGANGGYSLEIPGRDGGSGGGGCATWGADYVAGGGSGVDGQGHDGGAGANLAHYTQRAAGGGGGAGAAGSNWTTYYGGPGGIGVESAISGTATYYGGGGGGATGSIDSRGGAGGAGGGGRGAGQGGTAGSGVANTGGGGGGYGYYSNAVVGQGGSGIVILRYLTADAPGVEGGIVTTDGDYTVHTFVESGSLVGTEPVLVRNSFDQYYSLWQMLRNGYQQEYSFTEPRRTAFDTVYCATESFRAAFEMLWSVRMRAVFMMSYSDLPKHRARFDQVWERFRRLRNQAKFEYGDKDKLVAALDQVYRLMGGVRNKADFTWAVTEKPIRTLFNQVYQIKDKNKQRAVLRQLWIMVMGDAILQKDEVTITARRGDEVRTLNRVYDIDQEEDATLYYQAGDIKIDKANKQDDGLPNGEYEFLFCTHLETEVTISVTGGPDKTYLVREPYRDRDAHSGEVFIIPLRSKTILLDEQESDISLVKESDLIMVHYDGEILTGLSEAEFVALDKSKVTGRIDSSNGYGMRKSLVEMLAYPFSVEWNLPNTYLSANRLQIDTATRMTKIKEIVASLGGIVQSSDDGEELECKKEYKIPLAKLQQYIPEIELTDQEDAFRITQRHHSRPGYNRFLVTDRDISSDDIRTYNEQITAHQQQVQISWVPNTGQRCTLEKSRGNHVWIVNDGPREEVIETQIEIVAGVGTTLSRPFYGFEMVNGQKSIVWEDNDLGDLDIDESGVVKSTVPGNTLATIRYFTKYYQFQVHDPRNENAQVWPVIL